MKHGIISLNRKHGCWNKTINTPLLRKHTKGDYMALKIEYETPYGITCEYAHCVIVGATCGKEIESNMVEDEEIETRTYPIHYQGKIYVSDDAYVDGASPIGGFNGSFLMDVSDAKTQYNIIKQCYEDLKTKDGFTEGVDC